MLLGEQHSSFWPLGGDQQSDGLDAGERMKPAIAKVFGTFAGLSLKLAFPRDKNTLPNQDAEIPSRDTS